MEKLSNVPEKSYVEVEQALEELRRGNMVIVVDDEGRENEGDFIIAAEKATPAAINFMSKYGRGLICQAVTRERAEELALTTMTGENTSAFFTAFTVSVDARGVTTTGISAFDRAATIRAVIDGATKPDDLLKPGHIFPLVARDGGVLSRNGHTEAAVDLPRMAGLYPSGVLCEILDDDGAMARLPRLLAFAREHGLGILTVSRLVDYRKRTENSIVQRVSETRLPTEYGEFRLILYRSVLEPQAEHFALVKGNPAEAASPLVRIHSECLTGEALLSKRCDCGFQLREAMRRIQEEGGTIVYLRQEGRGIGFADKIRAYKLQDQGLDTVDANLRLGFAADERDYTSGAAILRDLGVSKIRLMTNNPDKVEQLSACGIDVEKRIGIESPRNRENSRYLSTKKQRFGHYLSCDTTGVSESREQTL